MLLIGPESVFNKIFPRFKSPAFLYSIYNDGIHPLLDVFPNAKQINYGLDPKSFDFVYCQMLLESDYLFYEYFNKIIYPLYNGYNVYILCPENSRDDNIYQMLMESFLKFIQQRYGYNGAQIYEEEDFNCINPDEMTFNINGLYNLDKDKERYSYMYTTNNTYKDSTGAVQIRGYEYK